MYHVCIGTNYAGGRNNYIENKDGMDYSVCSNN